MGSKLPQLLGFLVSVALQEDVGRGENIAFIRGYIQHGSKYRPEFSESIFSVALHNLDNVKIIRSKRIPFERLRRERGIPSYFVTCALIES